jgi:hypothetical protein
MYAQEQYERDASATMRKARDASGDASDGMEY